MLILFIDMYNIVYVSHESESLLGSSRSLYNMIHFLRKQVNPIVILPNVGPVYDFFKSRGIKCMVIHYPLDITEKSGIRYVLTFIPRFIRDYFLYKKTISYAKKNIYCQDIDIIHSNSSTVDWGYKLARSLKKPHVWHLREFQDLDFNFKPFLGWNHLINEINNSSVTISITHSICRHFKQEGKDNAYQLYNAVRSLRDIRLDTDKESYFLLCGNLSKAKGLELAISSFAIFSEKQSAYKLKFVGHINDIYKQKLMLLISRLNLDCLVEFEPFTDDIDVLFRKASGYLMCSKNEAMGRVTVEALFNGCPVIGYDGGGTPEIIKDGINGFLFKTPEQCAWAMQQVLNPEISSRIIENGFDAVRQYFTEESYRDKLLSIYSILK